METPNIISGRDKLSIHSPYENLEILEILEDPNLKSSRVEFHGITFDTVTLSLWQKHGSGMSSIEFFDCVFDDANIVAITEHCDSVTHLTWHYEKLTPRGTPFYSDNALLSLVKKKMTMNSLVALSVRLNDISLISVNTLPLLFSIYKNVKEFYFDFGNDNVDVRERVKNETGHTSLTSFGVLHKLVSSTEHIIGVNLKLPSATIYRGFAYKSAVPIHESLRSDNHNFDETVYKSPDDLIEFCARRRNLLSIQCDLNTKPVEGSPVKEEFATRFLDRVLKNCEQLRELKLNIDPSYDIVRVDVELFDRLIASKLESLDLSCEEIEIITSYQSYRNEKNNMKLDTSERKPIPPEVVTRNNLTLRSLSLKANNLETTIMFLKHFKQLKHLKIFNAEDEILQAIWVHQPKLTSLQLLNVAPYTWGFTGRGDVTAENYHPKQNTGMSISRLKNLQYLNIEAIEPDWNATDEIFDHFILPNLRYLDLEIMDNSGITTSMMASIEQNLPQLEAIILRYYNEVPYNIWKRLCSQMRHLRYLAIFNDSSIADEYSEEELQNLFKSCPTLRVLVHKHSTGEEVFYHNVVQGTVMKKNSNYVYDERNRFGMFLVKNIQV